MDNNEKEEDTNVQVLDNDEEEEGEEQDTNVLVLDNNEEEEDMSTV